MVTPKSRLTRDMVIGLWVMMTKRVSVVAAMEREDADIRGLAVALSDALKEFHRALIRAEIGDDPVLNNPYTMLFALIDNPALAWMGGLSRLIARIDEQVADGSIAEPAALAKFGREAAALIGEGEGEADPEFRLRHLTAIQKEPEVGLATGRLRAALAKLPR
jgi:hypothetical protein